jgi:hypothetical protein
MMQFARRSGANAGDSPLRQIDIYLSPRFDTRWLEE